MKAKELRIGNWIHLSSLTDGTEVDLQCSLFHMEEIGSIKYHYKPIPLTEEWLFKFGFEYRGWEWIVKRKEFIECFEMDDEGLYFTGGEGVKMSRYLTTVHDLQNFFYALTGEEL